MKGRFNYIVVVLMLSHGFTGIIGLPGITHDDVGPTLTSQSAGKDKCKGCIQFADQNLAQLMNTMINRSVFSTCTGPCQILATMTSPTVGKRCNALCNIVGINEFVKIVLMRTDMNPIYFCELLSVCPINDNGDAKFTNFQVNPQSGPQGVFAISYKYTSQNGTGTGMISLSVDTLDNVPIGQTFIHGPTPPRTFKGQYQLQARPDPSCDPAQRPCEKWKPGNYTIKISICNGECGSTQPHSQIYDQASASFTITENMVLITVNGDEIYT